MIIEIINKTDGSVRAHAAGCRDIGRETTRGEEHWTEEHATKRDAYLEYNADFIYEADGDESNGYVIDFAPCCNAMPAGGYPYGK